MERRKSFFARWRTSLLALLKLILSVLACVGFYYGAHYISEQSEEEINKIRNRPKPEWYLQVEQPVRMVVVDDQGRMSMEISGKKVRLSKDQKHAFFTGAHAVYSENGQTSLTMDAGQIEYNTDTEDFLLSDGLAIQTSDGMKVTSEQVEWHRVAHLYNYVDDMPMLMHGADCILCKAGGLIVIAPNKQVVATAGCQGTDYGCTSSGGFVARRAIVEDSRCNACHQELGTFTEDAFHAGQRNDGTTCSWCHNPNRTSSGWSANAKDIIHDIHGARKRVVDFTWHATEAGPGQLVGRETAIHLDAFEPHERQLREVHHSQTGVRERNAVEVDAHLVRGAAADRHGAEAAEAAVIADMQAREGVQDLGRGGDALVHRVQLEDRDLSRQAVEDLLRLEA